MKFSTTSLVSSALVAQALAQDMSICDKYTTALLKNNTAENQYTLLTLVVNTAVIGNYTQPNVGIKVPGILVPGTFGGEEINLLPYFNGGLLSSNRGGKTGMSVNFIDGGGAIPLAMNKAGDNENSNQFKLLSHLYQYFGALLGCSQYGKMGFPAYAGVKNQYEVHKHMNLNYNQMGYFITQVGLSAASFGVSTEDITTVAMALNSTFNQRCSPPQAVLPGEGMDLQAMCINSACPVAPSPVCSKYNSMGGSGVNPATATSTPGPQLTALAAQLSSISAGSVTMGSGSTMMSGSGSMMSGSSTMMSGSGSMMSGSGVMSVTSTVPTTITQVSTSGSSVITNVITTSAAITTTAAAASSTPNAAPVQTAAVGMMGLAAIAGLMGQMI